MSARITLATVLVAITLVPVLPAQAEAWRNSGGEHRLNVASLNLDQSADRQVLLAKIERAARKVCLEVRTQVKQDACKAEAAERALAGSPSSVRIALQTARLERDGVRQAQR